MYGVLSDLPFLHFYLTIISGANTGIGKSTATELAKRGARVVMGCRDQHKGEAVARMIRSKTKNPDVFSYQLDLASLSSIKSFVEDFNNRESSLHVLINNAGMNSTYIINISYFGLLMLNLARIKH